MATLLHRLGRSAFRRRRLVLALWLVIVAAVIACMAAFGGAAKLDQTFTIPGSQSQQALDRLKVDFPAASGTSAQIVFTAPAGQSVTSASAQAAIGSVLAAAKGAPQVDQVVSPAESGAISPDHSTAIGQVDYLVNGSDLPTSSINALESAVKAAPHGDLGVEVGGAALSNSAPTPGAEDLIGVLVAVIVLALTFGSLLTAGMPLLTALFGVITGVCGVLALTGVFTISSTALTLALMIGLAVGIDYALFIVTRHRGQLARGMAPEQSAALAIGTAGGAVVFAGLTVVIAMAGLSVVGIPFLTVMGLCAAGAVLVAVAVAVTLLPALLGFAGNRLAPKPGSRAARREQASGGAEADAPEAASGGAPGTLGTPAASAPSTALTAAPANLAERWVRLATRRPLLTVLAVVAVLAVLAWPARSMNLSLPDNSTAPSGSSQRIAYDEVSKSFGPGFNGPLLVLADTSRSQDPAAAAKQIAAELSAMPDVAAVAPPSVSTVSPTALIEVIPKSGPSDQATKDLVNTIRGRESAIERETGAQTAVTGTTAVGIDVSSKLGSALVPFAAVVVGLSLILLLLVFRSLVVPLKAAVGFLLSVAAAFGVVVGLFQWGHLDALAGVDRTGPITSFLPIIMMAVLFGLAMDYEVFLVSRMRESYVRSRDPLAAVHAGARHAGRVVTAAALIMFSVFAAFVTSEGMILKQIAFSLAIGILIDAFAVRMTFVPAVLALAGRSAWWLPRWLDRVLPNLDIEGEGLREAGVGAEADAEVEGADSDAGAAAVTVAVPSEAAEAGDGPEVAGAISAGSGDRSEKPEAISASDESDAERADASTTA